ncbi:MAG: hypothetical protein U0229_00490 [Anaeromyxobacter sp.]
MSQVPPPRPTAAGLPVQGGPRPDATTGLQPAHTEEGRAASAFVAALGKAARAFTLYDANNSLVRQFIGDYKARAEEATAQGALPLDVLPFDLARSGESVYHEDDREKSLAFRLFRDGVRRLTFAPGVPFEELLQLLQILAVRFSGVRQAEEDVVTLLRKAEFKGITLVAVEGYVPDEDLPEADAAAARGDAGVHPPAGFDRPFPKLPAPAAPEWKPVPEAALSALRAEEVEAMLAPNALRLARELLALGARGALDAGEVGAFLSEVRNFLVADAQLEPLAALAELASAQPAGKLRDAVLRGLADPRLVDAVLAAIPPGSAQLPPEAVKLLPFVPGGAVLDRLADEKDPDRRRILVRLASARLPADADAVVARLPGLTPEAARELWAAVRQRAPARADDASVALLDHADPDVRAEALLALAHAERRVPAASLVKLLSAPQEKLRIAAAVALEHHGDAAAARAVAAALTERKGLSNAEAEALGRTLAKLHPGVAVRLFEEWLEEKKGLLSALKGGLGRESDPLRWAAVAGLGAMPGEEAEVRIQAVALKAGPELKRHCAATLARRRAEGRRNG